MERLLKLTLATVLVVAMSAPAVAGTCDVTNLPTSTVITSSRLNARYNQVESCINGNIGDANIDANDPIANNKLAAPNALWSASFTLDCAAGTKAASFVPYTNATVVGISSHVDASGTFDYDIVLKKDTTTMNTQANITTATATLDTSIASASVTTANEVIIDITQTTAGTCTAVNVVVYLTSAHQS